jgi:hypothetical protein
MFSRPLNPWVPLLVFTAALAVTQSAYTLFQVVPSLPGTILLEYGPAFFLVLWVVADASRSRRVPCHDFGFFVMASFPFSVVWYVLWTRRLRGLLVLGALLGLFLAPWLCAVAVRVALIVLDPLHRRDVP